MKVSIRVLAGVVSVLALGGYIYLTQEWSTRSKWTRHAGSGRTGESGADRPERPKASDALVSRMNEEILRVRRADEIDPAIERIEAMARAAPEDEAGKIYGAALSSVRLFKGLLWRLSPLIEPIDLLRMGWFSSIEAIKFAPVRREDHLSALADYLIEPNGDENIGGFTGKFKSIDRFQDYVIQVLTPQVRSSIVRIKEAIEARKPEETLFEFDWALVVGGDEAQGFLRERRFRAVAVAHVWDALAEAQFLLGALNYLAAYDLNDLPTVNAAISRGLAGPSVWPSLLELRLKDPRKIASVLAEPRFGGFLVLRPQALLPGGGSLRASRQLFLLATQHKLKALIGFRMNSDLSRRKDYVYDGSARAAVAGIDEESLKRRQSLIKAEAPRGSIDRFTRKKMRIHVDRIFDASSPVVRDLKKLLADRFEMAPDPDAAWGEGAVTAAGFPDATFGGVFPEGLAFGSVMGSIGRDPATFPLATWLSFFSFKPTVYEGGLNEGPIVVEPEQQ